MQKQRYRLLEIAAEPGGVYHVEQKILDAATFPGVLGKYKVELNTGFKSFKATFDTDTEQLAKQFPNLAKTYEWLLSMTNAYKKGDLQKHLKSAHQSVKSDVAFDKAVHALAPKETDIAAAMKDMQPQDVVATGEGDTTVADVTFELMTVTKMSSAPMQQSTICMHRGSLNTFVTLGASSPDLAGILMGCKVWNGKCHVVQSVITSEDLQSLYTSPKITTACEMNHLVPCGVIVKGSHQHWYDHGGEIMEHFPQCSTPLLICVDYSVNSSGDVACWEFDNTEDVRIVPDHNQVELQWTTQPHDVKKRLTYNICWLKDFGSSHVETATIKICEAVVQHVAETTKKVHSRPAFIREVRKRIVNIPADGLCGWHSLIATSDLQGFERVPRQSTGYAVSHVMQQQDTVSAKDLHRKTCEDALKFCDPRFHEAIHRVQVQPAFSPADLEWIAATLDRPIRCTLCSEVRCVMKCALGFMYIEYYTITLEMYITCIPVQKLYTLYMYLYIHLSEYNVLSVSCCIPFFVFMSLSQRFLHRLVMLMDNSLILRLASQLWQMPTCISALYVLPAMRRSNLLTMMF